MNTDKRIKRIQTLLDRLNNEAQVSTRELEAVLTQAEIIELHKSWSEEKAMGRIKKPTEIVRYGELLKTACMYYGSRCLKSFPIRLILLLRRQLNIFGIWFQLIAN